MNDGNDFSQPRSISFSSRHTVGLTDHPIPDIDRDDAFMRIFGVCRQFSMTSKAAMYALYQATRYVCARNIPGAVVECGVWRGGSALLAALTCRAAGDDGRAFYLYDTFEGMTQAQDVDVDIDDQRGNDLIQQFGDDGKWCYADDRDVVATFLDNGIDRQSLHVVKGDVMTTLPNEYPESIALLRLDTDWYASTKLELEMLYPKLQAGGILIIDDYGHWSGARKAVDEYFATNPVLLSRVDQSVRLIVKP